MDKVEDTKNTELAGDKLAITEDITETEEYLLRKKARAAAVADADGAHDRAMGASGSPVDFGRPENYTGVKDNGL